MQAIASAIQLIIDSFIYNSKIALTWLAILWLCQIVNRLLRYVPNYLGIVPRTLFGLRGIIFSPFLHGDFNHLFFNSIPFFVLANLILMRGTLAFYIVSVFIIVFGGFLLWLFGKRGIHIGASTLIMGYFGYLLAEAYFQLNATTIILALICLYYFGGLILALFPGKKHISWEGHVCGFVAGITTAYLYPLFIVMLKQLLF
jgi:membrane associated rhomboid family serine protease